MVAACQLSLGTDGACIVASRKSTHLVVVVGEVAFLSDSACDQPGYTGPSTELKHLAKERVGWYVLA